MRNGYYIMGKYTSVAWYAQLCDAVRMCKQMNYRGGQNYHVEECK